MSAPLDSYQAAKLFDQWIDDGVTGAYNDRIRKVSLQLVKMIVQSCPVDTGRFKAAWDVEINRWATGVPVGEGGTGGNSGAAGRMSNRRASTALGTLKDSKEVPDFVGISNNLPYGPELEYGRLLSGRSGARAPVSKKQDPGFVRAAVEGVRSMLRAGRFK